MMKHCVILMLMTICQTVGWSQPKESSVLSFYYGGFGDTTVAFLKVTSNLEEFELKILSNNSLFKDTTIKSNQYFGFSHGYWNLLFYKEGYDTIMIKNYYAVPDQVSTVNLYQLKGNKKVVYTTKPPSFLFPKNGTDSTFYENKRLNSLSSYRNDTLIYQVKYFNSGSLKYKMKLLENGLTSAIKYFDNGQLEFIAYWNKSTTEGYRKEFFRDGRLKEHLLNTEEGQLRWYYADSAGVATIEMGNTLMEYRANKGLDTTINIYRGGLKDGRWISHRSDGTILWVEEYENGKKVLFEHYSSDGILTRRVENLIEGL